MARLITGSGYSILDCDNGELIVKQDGQEKAKTNGEKFMETFPEARLKNMTYTFSVAVLLPYHTEHDTGILFDKEWWNSPYKGVSE